MATDREKRSGANAGRAAGPPDVLHVETEVLDKEPWQGNLGLVRSQTRVYNEDDTEVMSMVGLLLFEMREA